MKAISVSQLNNYVNRVVSSDPILNDVAVRGEVSSLTKHSSGHYYFELKDENARVRCFLSHQNLLQLRFDFENGMELTVYGNVSVFTKTGAYTLQIRDAELSGEGSLRQSFELLKAKLDKEGLFDPLKKKKLPSDPHTIGVVTSPTGAAIRDIISTIKRRNNQVDILLYPALVQGSGSADSVCRGIRYFNSRNDIDLIIVGRGGGSSEDLWTFNEESVARQIYSSKLPVISAVGHETDHLISDLAADVRAATPTAAAELAVPHLDNIKDILYRLSPEKLYPYLLSRAEMSEYKLRMLKTAIDGANPGLTLNKGFSLVSKDSSFISSASELKSGDTIRIKFSDGEIKAIVQ